MSDEHNQLSPGMDPGDAALSRAMAAMGSWGAETARRTGQLGLDVAHGLWQAGPGTVQRLLSGELEPGSPEAKQAAIDTALAWAAGGSPVPRPAGTLGAFGAWHGTGAHFDEFAPGYELTGSGAQAQGHGHYVAGAKGVAESYLPEEEGSLLEVHVHPDHEEFLDWDLPFWQQEPGVQQKLDKMMEPFYPAAIGRNDTGADIYYALKDHLYDKEADRIQQQYGIGTPWAQQELNIAANDSEMETSRVLHEAGIPGNRYLDAQSRNAAADVARHEEQVRNIEQEYAAQKSGTADWLYTGSRLDMAREWLRKSRASLANPTYNYVVFDPSNLTIKSRNGVPLELVDHDPFAGGTQ